MPWPSGSDSAAGRALWPLAPGDARSPAVFPQRPGHTALPEQNGTTAGYDPTFMAGYAKSVVFPASSTLPKSSSRSPVGMTRPFWRTNSTYSSPPRPFPGSCGRPAGPGARLTSVGVVADRLPHVCLDRLPDPVRRFGMLPYLLGVPLALLATLLVANYLSQGGVPAVDRRGVGLFLRGDGPLDDGDGRRPGGLTGIRAGGGYVPDGTRSGSSVWPGISVCGWSPWLSWRSMPSGGGRASGWPRQRERVISRSLIPKGFLARLGKILTVEPPIQAVLWAIGLPGWIALAST